jgi:hypothetical protein
MAKITVQLAPLRNAQWSATPLKPGGEVTLSVEAPKIKAGQHIEFRILYGTDLVDVVNGQDAQQTAKWTVPNLPHSPRLKFDALLHEKPSPKAGIHGVLGKVSSPLADVRGFAVTITNIDANFVPHAEQIQVAYTVSDPGGVAKSARIEVWGERYSTNQPLYRTAPFAPAHGAHNWNTWDGKANLGPLAGKYITPEYSPYRLRIIAGVDQASVDDPFAAGLKKVAIAEKPFEVEFQSAWIRVQAGIVETAAAGSNYSLAQALAVEPYNPNGTFTVMGRLPLEQETGPPNRPGVGRIRIPMACHHRSPADSLAQPGLAIGSGYGTVKQAVDALFYSRPEIPLEFEMRLKSRVDATNKTPSFGLFDKEAVGPVKIEPFAEDVFVTALYNGAGVNQTYWRKAACKVKHGTHAAPVNDGVSAPLFHHWQARFTVAADGTQNFDLDTFDAADQTYRYVVGSGELKVYLNRTMLTLGANEAAMNKGDADYIEVDVHTIKLRPNLTKANDVLWVVRSAAAGAVANWNAYPPGVNCHAQYGGVRGAAPNNLFLKNYSPAPGGVREPVIGNVGGAYAYNAHNFINLSPDPVAAANQERVEVSAILTGAQQGLAGIIFTPSFMAGDTYRLHARLNRTPYERNLGWEDDQPFIDGKSGQVSIWRVITISNSQRLPTAGTAGLAGAIGSTAEAPVGGRTHIGDGVTMSVSGMNVTLSNAFNEWTTPPPNPAIAPAGDVHKDVNLGTYIATNNGLAMGAGRVNMPNNGAVLNVFVAFDHYRVLVPADIPANRVNATANAIAALPAGRTSAQASAALVARFAPLGAADEPAGAPAIAPHANFGKAYSDWVLGQIRVHRQTLINALTPSLAPQPKTMQVIRWPNLHDSPIWNQFAGMGSAGMTITGFENGNGQSFFRTSNPGADAALFPHEMGHGSHLVHFVAGNFGWKHHNVLQPGCMMSYNFPTGFIVPGAAPTVGPVGGAAAPDTGWPNVVPAVLPANSSIVAGTAPGTQCIQLGPPAPTAPCAKCLLKLRGWREDLLPVAWSHPDLF